MENFAEYMARRYLDTLSGRTQRLADPAPLAAINAAVRRAKDGCTPADDQRAIEFLVFDAFREGGRHG